MIKMYWFFGDVDLMRRRLWAQTLLLLVRLNHFHAPSCFTHSLTHMMNSSHAFFFETSTVIVTRPPRDNEAILKVPAQDALPTTSAVDASRPTT